MLRIAVPVVLLVNATAVAAQPAGVNLNPWRTQIQGSVIHRFDTDIDDGGAFSVTRLFVEPGLSYAFGPRDSVGVAFGYSLDDYDFSGSEGLAGLDPWGTINEYRLSAPARLGLGERFGVFALPSIRWSAESGGDLGEAVTGGLLAGFSYAVNDRLKIGPGFGVFSQLEDDVSAFPILLIDWQITDTLSLDTGSVLGATRGPGLGLNWRGLEDWTFGIGARYETYRFRLDDSGSAPDGVGEEKGVPIHLQATYAPIPTVRLTAVAGAAVAGTLTLDDEDGREIREEDVDPSPFLGFGFRARF